MGATADKGGKKELPFTTISITFWDEYIAAAGISGDANGYLF
jgi:hypothetical protein